GSSVRARRSGSPTHLRLPPAAVRRFLTTGRPTTPLSFPAELCARGYQNPGRFASSTCGSRGGLLVAHQAVDLGHARAQRAARTQLKREAAINDRRPRVFL